MLKKFLRYPSNLLILIILLGFFIRSINVTSNPPSMYGDELTLVYDAYSLYKTGKDITGQTLPFTFFSAEGRPPGYVYLTIPFVALFGPTALAVRSLSVISGVLLVLVIFLLARKLSNQNIGLFAAFLLAISPWDLSLSRGGFEAHLALFFATLGVSIFLLNEKIKWWILSALALGSSTITYPSYKLAAPLIVPAILFLKFDKLASIRNQLGKILLFLVFLAIFACIWIWQSQSQNSEARFQKINLFAQEDIRSEIDKKVYTDRNLATLSVNLKPFFYNQYIEYSLVVIESYLRNLSIDFLFLRGDQNPRHNMVGLGEFYIFELVSVIFGLIFFYRLNKKHFIFLVSWILIGALPSSLFLNPHALRGSFMLPPLIILSAAGLWYILKTLSGRLNILRLGFVAICLVCIAVFFSRLYFVSPKLYSRFWSYPAKQAVLLANEKKNNFDKVIISDRIESAEAAFYAYNQILPQKIWSKESIERIDEYTFKRFGNIYLGQFPLGATNRILSSLPGKVFYIGDYSESDQVEYQYIESGLDGKRSLIVKFKE